MVFATGPAKAFFGCQFDSSNVVNLTTPKSGCSQFDYTPLLGVALIFFGEKSGFLNQ